MNETRELDLAFQANVQAYLELLPELLRESGKFVVIADAKKAGIYATRDQAVGEGCKTFGRVGFIVRQIDEEDLRVVPEWLAACPT